MLERELTTGEITESVASQMELNRDPTPCQPEFSSDDAGGTIVDHTTDNRIVNSPGHDLSLHEIEVG